MTVTAVSMQRWHLSNPFTFVFS